LRKDILNQLVKTLYSNCKRPIVNFMNIFLGELIGTGLLMLFGTGVNANVSLKRTYGHDSGWLTITFGWGLAVFVGVFVAGPVSGAHINPAVTIGRMFLFTFLHK
jgi:glycerol uptake facilitator protein